ncbi:AP-2 complex subunit alpha-2 [Xylographa carneopallida]|nr:AP-2 complex subunit alpha-2 [Xylographa carneopallida]
MSLDSAQLTQALRALYTYIARKSSSTAASTSQLFDEDQFIYLQISLKRTPNRSTTKPYPLPLPHPLYTADTELCLITKDPPPMKAHPTALSTTTAPNALKQYFAAHPVPGLNRVIGVTKLRKEFGRFKERRELLALYDLFLADDRILPLLPAVLGVKFFDKKKQPIPVDLSGAAKEKSILKALRCTYLYVPTGSSLQVKVARSSMSRVQVAENVMGVIGRLVERLPGKWKGVQMVGVKCGDSITIPVYQSLPLQAIRGSHSNGASEKEGADEEEEGAEDAAMDGVDEQSEQAEEEEEEAEAVKTPVNKAVEAGKKRKHNEAEEESTTPLAAKVNTTPAKTQAKTPIKTPVAQRTATPKQSGGASASKRVAAMLQREEEDDEDEDELEVTLHPDLLDEEDEEEQQATRTPVQSSKRGRQDSSAAATPKRAAAATATPVNTPATAKGRASAAANPRTPTAAAEPSTATKRRRVEEERKENAEAQSPASARSTPKSNKAQSTPSPAASATPKRRQPFEESKDEQAEESVTPLRLTMKGNRGGRKTPATTRTASKVAPQVEEAEDEAQQEEQKSAPRPAKARKAASGRMSLPASAGAEKSRGKAAPASARKSKA